MYQDARIRAYPKVNIALSVYSLETNSRLHRLESRFHLVIGSIYDTLHFAIDKDIESNLPIFYEGQEFAYSSSSTGANIDGQIDSINQSQNECSSLDIESPQSKAIYNRQEENISPLSLRGEAEIINSQTKIDISHHCEHSEAIHSEKINSHSFLSKACNAANPHLQTNNNATKMDCFAMQARNDGNIKSNADCLANAHNNKWHNNEKDVIDSKKSPFVLHGNFNCPLESNLIYKAYKLLLPHKTNSINKITISVTKNIKAGGGLGGGSVNAAIALIVLNKILESRLDKHALLNLAYKLGSDVPFFVLLYLQNNDSLHPFFIESNRKESLDFLSANVENMGDIVSPFYEGAVDISLHVNDIACNTGLVYKAFDNLRLDSKKLDFSAPSLELLLNHNIDELNNLYLPACSIYPLESIYKNLAKRHDKVFFSGSGSTFFTLDKGKYEDNKA